MSKIKIMCTSTGCIEYGPEEYRNLGIDIIRIHMFFQDKEYLEGPDLDPAEFYKALENTKDTRKNLPHTAMPTSGEIYNHFQKALEEGYDEVIVISLSSYLGGTWNFICLMAEEFRSKFKKITVIDAKITCFQEGLLAIKAQQLVNQGASHETIVQEVEWMIKHQEFIGLSTKLDYMIFNGRLKGGKAYLGKALSICPVLQFNHQGELAPLTNAMGPNQTMVKVMKQLKKWIGNRDPKDYLLFRCYTGRTLEDLQNKMEAKFGIKTNAPAVIMSTVTGCHVGPWTEGYSYTPIRRNDEPLDPLPEYYYKQNRIEHE